MKYFVINFFSRHIHLWSNTKNPYLTKNIYVDISKVKIGIAENRLDIQMINLWRVYESIDEFSI